MKDLKDITDQDISDWEYERSLMEELQNRGYTVFLPESDLNKYYLFCFIMDLLNDEDHIIYCCPEQDQILIEFIPNELNNNIEIYRKLLVGENSDKVDDIYLLGKKVIFKEIIHTENFLICKVRL